MKLKILLIIVWSVGTLTVGGSQSCCSGGVPVSNNIGFQSSNAGTFQLSVSGDFNFLRTLKSGSETLDDNFRLRTTQSYIIRSAYSFGQKWTIESFFPVVRQTRKITTLSGEIDREATFGVGDPLLFAVYDIIQKSTTIRIGAGPQIPLGSFSQTDNRGLILLEDLQPGSGAWDLIFFGSLEYRPASRPSSLVYMNNIYSVTGANKESRGGSQEYEFGNDLQIIAGFSDQILIGTQIISPGISVRYRHAQRDMVNHQQIPGSGGDFVYTRLSSSFPLANSSSSLNFNFEFPLYSRANETQLVPSMIINIGWFKSFEPSNPNESLIDLN